MPKLKPEWKPELNSIPGNSYLLSELFITLPFFLHFLSWLHYVLQFAIWEHLLPFIIVFQHLVFQYYKMCFSLLPFIPYIPFITRATWRWKATAAITQSLGSTLPMTWSSASRTREDSRWTLQLATITGVGKVLARGWRSGPKIRELAYGLTVQDSGILQV